MNRRPVVKRKRKEEQVVPDVEPLTSSMATPKFAQFPANLTSMVLPGSRYESPDMLLQTENQNRANPEFPSAAAAAATPGLGVSASAVGTAATTPGPVNNNNHNNKAPNNNAAANPANMNLGITLTPKTSSAFLNLDSNLLYPSTPYLSAADIALLQQQQLLQTAAGTNEAEIAALGNRNSFAWRESEATENNNQENAYLSAGNAGGGNTLNPVPSNPVPGTIPFFTNPNEGNEDENWPIPNFEDTYTKMRDVEKGIPRCDRRYRLLTYSSCFVGSEAVDWMTKNMNMSREEAIHFGQKLMDVGIFHHVTQSEPFQDEYFFYRFQEDEDSSILNMKRVWEQGRPVRPALDVAQDLITKLACLCEEYRLSILTARNRNQEAGSGQHAGSSSKDSARGDAVDYQALAKSDAFRQYCFAAAELQRVDLFGLDQEERLAFFVNVYNTLCLHCHIVLGTPTNFFRRWLFFRSMCYRVSGLDFSLDDIEHGILRGNKCSPSLRIIQQLRPYDPKCQYILKKREGRIHFVISAGTASDPPIRILDADNVEEELHFSTDEFLNHTVRINVAKKTVTLPRIFSWYADDFPSPQIELLKWISQYLRSDQQIALNGLINEEKGDIPTIVYENFEWSNADARFNAAVVRKKRRRLERERKAMDRSVSPHFSNAGGPPVNQYSPILVQNATTTMVGNSGAINSPAIMGPPIVSAETPGGGLLSGLHGLAGSNPNLLGMNQGLIRAHMMASPNMNMVMQSPGWPTSVTAQHLEMLRQQQQLLEAQLMQHISNQAGGAAANDGQQDDAQPEPEDREQYGDNEARRDQTPPLVTGPGNSGNVSDSGSVHGENDVDIGAQQ